MLLDGVSAKCIFLRNYVMKINKLVAKFKTIKHSFNVTLYHIIDSIEAISRFWIPNLELIIKRISVSKVFFR